jgi:ATP sulfurylase
MILKFLKISSVLRCKHFRTEQNLFFPKPFQLFPIILFFSVRFYISSVVDTVLLSKARSKLAWLKYESLYTARHIQSLLTAFELEESQKPAILPIHTHTHTHTYTHTHIHPNIYMTSWYNYHMPIQMFKLLILNMAVFWNVVSCSLVETDQYFGDAYGLHHQGNDSPDDGGSKYL